MSADATPWYAKWWVALLLLSGGFYIAGSNQTLAPVVSLLTVVYLVYVVVTLVRSAFFGQRIQERRIPKKSAPQAGCTLQIRAAMLELGFWKYVFRVGFLLFGYALAVGFCASAVVSGFEGWSGVAGIIVVSLLWGFVFGILSWGFVKLVAPSEKPIQGGKYYDALMKNTSTSRLVYLTVAFVVVMYVFSAIAPSAPVEEVRSNSTLIVDIMAPPNNYVCSSLDVASASERIVEFCNAYNYCDKMTAYDITVRKSATEAIAPHLDQAYSVDQIIDVYAWAKENIDYQNVPLDDFAPYRPSETIALKSGDCKNYAAVISSMVLSIGGFARIVTVPACAHAFAEVLIGGEEELSSLVQRIAQRYWLQDSPLNIINDSYGYWLILDGAGADYPGTTEIEGCLDPDADRYYAYSCVSPEGRISKQTYKKEHLSPDYTWPCTTCLSVNDCGPECRVFCIRNEWDGHKSAEGYVIGSYAGRNYISCSCSCYYYADTEP